MTTTTKTKTLPTHGADIVALDHPSERNVRNAEGIKIGDHVRATLAANASRKAVGINDEFLRARRTGGRVTQIVRGSSWVSVRIKLDSPPVYPDGSEQRSPDAGYCWDFPRELEVG